MRPAAKIALVTGAGRRIGRAIAVDLARAGWHVAVHHNRSADAAAATVDEILGLGGVAVAFRADLVDEADTAALVPAVAERLGPPTCLVNNASTFEPDTVATATLATWNTHMAVNLRAPFVLAQQFARLLPADADGALVNIIDERVWNPTPNFISYTVSKAGLWMLTRTLALALAPRIRVNAVGPGPTLANVHQTVDEFAAQAARTPLGRGATPEEIAAAVRFLLEASSVTGQMLALDGGQHLGWAHPDPGTPAAQD